MPHRNNQPILVVDDYKTMLRIVRNLLKQIGYDNIDEVTDGNVALNRLREKSYQLVISDLDMAPLSGLDLLSRVRSDARLKQTPFLMIAAGGEPENIAEATRAGADNVIVKPFNAEALRAKLASVLAA